MPRISFFDWMPPSPRAILPSSKPVLKPAISTSRHSWT